MDKGKYIVLDGEFLKSSDKVFTIENRGFKYGDALFETIRVVDGKPCFIEDHFARLKEGMDYLKMKSSGNMSFKKLQELINELIVKNKITKGGRIRLSVFRKGNGLYEPDTLERSYVIEAKPLPYNEYILNENGLVIDFYNQHKKYRNKLSLIKTNNSIPQILASIYKKEQNLDDCIMVNDVDRIAEAISSNIFMFKNNCLYTPSLEEGCMNGIMRKQILEIAKSAGYSVFEGMLTGSALMQADEVFLTNAIKGIMWVGAYRQKRYYNNVAKQLTEALNQLVKVRVLGKVG